MAGSHFAILFAQTANRRGGSISQTLRVGVLLVGIRGASVTLKSLMSGFVCSVGKSKLLSFIEKLVNVLLRLACYTCQLANVMSLVATSIP